MQKSMPGLSRTLGEVVRQVMADLEGRAPITEVLDRVKHTASYAEWTAWSEAAVVMGVRAALRTKTAGGLPEHLSVDGEYVALTLFSVEQYEEAARGQVRRGRQFVDSARLLQHHCQEAHGRSFDVEAIIREALTA